MPDERSLIAIVDDDLAFLEFVCELLSEEGYRTVQCVKEHGAYEMIQYEQPDLVLLDIQLEHPDSGWHILQMIRLNLATKDTPVIVCSADSLFLKEQEQQLREQRCDILEKPFDLEMLLEKVQAMLRR